MKLLAGSSDFLVQAGYTDGMAGDAMFNGPGGITVDKDGNVYVADAGNHVIRKIAPDGMVTTLAGLPMKAGFVDGKASQARFNYPTDLELDEQGNLLVADSANHAIRIVSPDGTVTTLAGNGQPGKGDAGTDLPGGRRTPRGRLSARRSAGAQQPSSSKQAAGEKPPEDDLAPEGQFRWPQGIAIDKQGNVYVADAGNNRICKIRR